MLTQQASPASRDLQEEEGLGNRDDKTTRRRTEWIGRGLWVGGLGQGFKAGFVVKPVVSQVEGGGEHNGEHGSRAQQRKRQDGRDEFNGDGKEKKKKTS